MVIIRCTGSSSAGNNYVIECEGEKLLIEAGIHIKYVEQALDFNLRGIAGVIITHEHLDHAAFVKQFLHVGIPVFATEGTLKMLDIQANYLARPVTYRVPFQVGRYRIMSFDTEHDAKQPCGFLIDCPDGNRILFVTDTKYLRYKFQNVNIFMIECNYDRKLLIYNMNEGIVNRTVAKRIVDSHMSLRQCIATLQSNDLTKTKAIMLIHLSNDNGRKEEFIEAVKKATGKMVFVAKHGSFCDIL